MWNSRRRKWSQEKLWIVFEWPRILKSVQAPNHRPKKDKEYEVFVFDRKLIKPTTHHTKLITSHTQYILCVPRHGNVCVTSHPVAFGTWVPGSSLRRSALSCISALELPRCGVFSRRTSSYCILLGLPVLVFTTDLLGSVFSWQPNCINSTIIILSFPCTCRNWG